MKKTIKNKTRAMAICSVLSALGVVIMYLGTFIEIMDLSLAVLASVFVTFAVIEFGGTYPWLMYFVTSVLSLLVLPNKFPAAAYFCFVGFYPIVKEKIERLPRWLCYVLKFVIFNFSFVVMYAVAKLLGVNLEGGLIIIGVVLVLNFTFLIYDYALSAIIVAYIYKWRKKLKIDEFLK